MAGNLASICDHRLTEALGNLGLARFARGVYAQSGDEVIWRGLWVTFNVRNGILITQPSIGVFCPTAEKLVSDGLRELHGRQVGRSYFGKLGGPILTRPLESLVRSITGEDRMPPAYHAATVEQIGEVTALMRDDFTRVGRPFLDSIDSMSKLRDQLMTDGATGARMYAIAVTYLMDEHVTPAEIDKVLGPQPNAMSREFAEYFKRKLVRAPA
jgi:hypothetical protein